VEIYTAVVARQLLSSERPALHLGGLEMVLARIFHGRTCDANQVAIRMKNPGSV
jgi:hypothetical protein